MSGLFADLDEQLVGRAAEMVGTRLAVASAFSLAQLARDDTMPPAEMAAGLVKAHLLGAASALHAARGADQLVIEDPAALAADVAAFIVEALQGAS